MSWLAALRKAWGLDQGWGKGKHSLGSPGRLAALRGLMGEIPSGLFCCPQPLSLVHTLAYSILLVFIF